MRTAFESLIKAVRYLVLILITIQSSMAPLRKDERLKIYIENDEIRPYGC